MKCDELESEQWLDYSGEPMPCYPKADDTERRITFKNPRIRIGTGRPEWGAEPSKMYFVISWEE